MRLRCRIPFGVWLAVAVLPGTGTAQLAAGTDLDVRSRYVWRGVVRSSSSVVQPSLFLSWQPEGWTFTTGAWANIEAFGKDDRSLSDAGRSRRLSELDYWVEAHTRRAGFDLRLGGVIYDLRGDALQGGRDSDWDTAELYASAALLLRGLSSIRLETAIDVSAIKGAWFTLEGLEHIPVVGLHGIMFSLLVGGEVGASAGLQLDPANPDELGYFANDGITHVLWSASLRVYGQRLGGYIGWTLQANRDRLTRVVNFGENRDTQHWFEAGVSALIGPLARERR